jgi:hypothetical protein
MLKFSIDPSQVQVTALVALPVAGAGATVAALIAVAAVPAGAAIVPTIQAIIALEMPAI